MRHTLTTARVSQGSAEVADKSHKGGEFTVCVGAIQAGGQSRSEAWRVDRDEETAMFGERTEQSSANLYEANWKQQSRAPEAHS